MPSGSDFPTFGSTGGNSSRRAQLGRTAIMNFFFFLQESAGVPLNYQFSLYSYGPFDSDVLADISAAERLDVLKSSTVYYPSGMV